MTVLIHCPECSRSTSGRCAAHANPSSIVAGAVRVPRARHRRRSIVSDTCATCHRPRAVEGGDPSGKLLDRLCYVDTGQYGRTTATLHCLRAALARATEQARSAAYDRDEAIGREEQALRELAALQSRLTAAEAERDAARATLDAAADACGMRRGSDRLVETLTIDRQHYAAHHEQDEINGATIANLRQQLAVATEAAALNARERDAALADRDRQLAEARGLLEKATLLWLDDDAEFERLTDEDGGGWRFLVGCEERSRHATLAEAVAAYRAATGDK